MHTMKTYTHRSLLVLMLMAASLFLAACATNPQQGENGEGQSETDQANQGQSFEGAEELEIKGLRGIPDEDKSEFTDPDNPLSTRIIYFGFDTSKILPRFEEVIEAHADYLKDHENVRVRLEGHTDERGTREYNIALGEDRASAVKQALVMLGVNKGQISILSYGEERPAVDKSTKEAYAKNRRVEFIYVK